MTETVRYFNSQFDIHQELDDGIRHSLMVMQDIQKIHEHRINFLLEMMPRIPWTSAYLIQQMMKSAADLRLVIDEYRKGQVATEALGNLLNIPELKKGFYAGTEFVALRVINKNTFNLEFNLLDTSTDTFIFKVNPFKYWENLTDTPVFMEYRGSQYLIYNQTNDCMKAIDEPASTVVDEKCSKANYTDPKLKKCTNVK